jgi:hypothetical protein
VNGKLEAEDAGGSIKTCPCSEGFFEFEISRINFIGVAMLDGRTIVRGTELELQLVVVFCTVATKGNGDR